MLTSAPTIEEDEIEAAARTLAVAIAGSGADPRTAPHDDVRAWWRRLTQSEFDAALTEPR